MSVKKSFFDVSKTLLTIYRVLKNLKYHHSSLPKATKDQVIILGTGPSLKEMLEKNIEAIKKYDLFAVNKFCTRSEYVQLQPKNYVLLDALFSTKEMPVEHTKLRDDVFNALVEKTSWNMYLYIPSNTDMREEINSFFKKNPLIHIVYFSMTTVEGLEPVAFKLYEKGYGMPFAGNVLVAAVLLAINIGYEKVILSGADMSMHMMAAVNTDNELCLEETNYYDKKNECKPLGRMVYDYYFMIARTFESFVQLKQYADFKGTEVINCSMESFIDVFEKKESKDVI